MQYMTMVRHSAFVALRSLMVALLALVGPALAQEDGFRQIKLSEDQVLGYIKVAPKLSKLFDRIDQAGDKPDPNLQKDLEALAKEGGYKSFDEMEVAVSNITFVMSGIDDQDGSFKEPMERLKEELEDTQADPDLKADEKKQLVQSIKDSMAQTPKLEHPENVQLVQKYFKQLTSLFE